MSWFEALFLKVCLNLNLPSNGNQLPNKLNGASAVSSTFTRKTGSFYHP